MNRTGLFLLLLLLAPTVQAQDPAVASFDYEPAKVRVGQGISFHSTSTGNVTNHTWDFGDGVVAYGPSVEHVFHEAGRFVVALSVTDASGQRSQYGEYVEVLDPAVQGVSAFLPNWLFWAMPLLVGTILLTLGYLVLQRGQPVIHNLVFFLLYLASGLKSVTESFAVLTIGTSAHTAFVEVNESIAYAYAPLFLWFVLVFPRPVRPWLVEGRRGALTLLLAAPFLLNQAFGWIPFEAALNYFNAFVSLIGVSCLALLVYHAYETDGYEERARIRYLSITFGLVVVSALVITFLNFAQTYQATTGDGAAAASLERATAVFALVIAPLLEVVGAMLMMYAILRFQLMGIQSLVVKITRGAAVALMVPATFIIVGNIIEEIFQNVVLEGTNLRFDFIIAGFASAFAMAPVQKFTTFVLNKFLPALTVAEESARRIQIYETQLRYSLLDGALNDKEVAVLRALAQEIKLEPQELETISRTFPTANLGGLFGKRADTAM